MRSPVRGTLNSDMKTKDLWTGNILDGPIASPSHGTNLQTSELRLVPTGRRRFERARPVARARLRALAQA